jgi:hypothetical protein
MLVNSVADKASLLTLNKSNCPVADDTENNPIKHKSDAVHNYADDAYD